ncbi:hypothetical protein [Natronosalvus vescus]|uniref:hypothetical protein n=1 Tax=Natronosalvus vescus TaxID=2953881 RepID=UPI002090AF17|nr:hypothetical protein [Natronosalvus vescus]
MDSHSSSESDELGDRYPRRGDRVDGVLTCLDSLEMDIGDVIADTPWRTSGYDASGEPIENAAQYLDDDVPNPF